MAAPCPDPLADLHTLDDFEAAARRVMDQAAFDYVSGGVADEATLADNRAAYTRLRLRPRALVDVSHIDTRLTLFGDEHDCPLLLAPTAYNRVVRPEGELGVVAGASAAGVSVIASSFATTSVEEMARAAQRPMWFQLYVAPDREFTRDLVQRAQEAGCRALCLTVDVPANGVRDREVRSGFRLPPGLERANLTGLGPALAGGTHRHALYSGVRDPGLTWADLEWLRSICRVPLLLKGVLTGEDAGRAVAEGVDGVVVSNHGGRSLDTLPATLDALPEVADAVAGRVPVLADGGVRRGTDALKLLALGARAVLVGRPYLHGLAVAGAAGVERVIEILRHELESAMALVGRPSLKEIDRTALW